MQDLSLLSLVIISAVIWAVTMIGFVWYFSGDKPEKAD